MHSAADSGGEVHGTSVTDPRNRPIEEVGVWMNGDVLTDRERQDIADLRKAGCKCLWPLLGYRPYIGPRCRLCNVVADMT